MVAGASLIHNIGLFLAVFTIFSQEKVQDHADASGNQRTEKSTQEPGITESEADSKGSTQPTSKSKHQRIDHKGEQSKTENDEQAGKCFNRRTDDGIHQPKDECQPDYIHPASL